MRVHNRRERFMLHVKPVVKRHDPLPHRLCPDGRVPWSGSILLAGCSCSGLRSVHDKAGPIMYISSGSNEGFRRESRRSFWLSGSAAGPAGLTDAVVARFRKKIGAEPGRFCEQKLPSRIRFYSTPPPRPGCRDRHLAEMNFEPEQSHKSCFRMAYRAVQF